LVRGILAATARLYWHYPLLFAILALGVMAPYELAVLAISGHGPLAHGHSESLEISTLLTLLRAALITGLISALHVHAVVAIGEGRRPRLGAVALKGIQVLPVVAATEVMSSLGELLGFAALIIPGIVLTLRWSVAAQAAAIEREGWLSALRSSRRLTREQYEHVFTLLLLTGVLTFVVHVGATVALEGDTSSARSVLIGIAIDTLLASFSALTLAVLYFELRGRPAEPALAPREHPHLRDLN
jgi:hypothetical protein